MAIERKGKVMAFDDAMATQEAPPEMEGATPEAEAMEAPESETATLSLEMLGGQKVTPGDVVRLEVVGVSDEDGTVTVKYATPKPGGIAKASAAFNEGS